MQKWKKELLAIVFECKKYDQFIFARKVTVKTDHKPLISLFKKPLINAQ